MRLTRLFVLLLRWQILLYGTSNPPLRTATGVRDYSTAELKHNVVALAKAAKALKLPIVVTTTARDSMWGPTFPELVEALPGIDRSSVNAFDDARVARAIEATGRKKSFHLFKSV